MRSPLLFVVVTLAALVPAPLAAQEENETITLLLRKPIATDRAALTKIAAKAFAVPLDKWNQSEDAPHFVVFDAKPAKQGQSGDQPRPDNVAVIKSGDRVMLVSFFGSPSFPDPKQAAKQFKELRLRKAIREHRAWMSVILRGPKGKAAIAASNRIASRMAAGFVTDNALAVEFSSEKSFRAIEPGMAKALWNDKPLQAVRNLAKVPVIGGENNPELDAAIAEAKKRFGEFVAAHRDGKGDQFFVKCPFTEGEFTEHLWLIVSKIANGSVSGRIGNEPVDLKKIKAGQAVTRKSTDCSDWLIVKGGKMVGGGFTVKVLRKQAERRARGGKKTEKDR